VARAGGASLRDDGADMADQDEIERLRAERDEWRRRAEVAEAVAVERLARAETAERALRGAAAPPPPPPPPPGDLDALPPPPEPAPKRPASLIERWRRYTDSLS
jgi:hypothetical protein